MFGSIRGVRVPEGVPSPPAGNPKWTFIPKFNRHMPQPAKKGGGRAGEAGGDREGDARNRVSVPSPLRLEPICARVPERVFEACR